MPVLFAVLVARRSCAVREEALLGQVRVALAGSGRVTRHTAHTREMEERSKMKTK
jgi:hypothetical protein